MSLPTGFLIAATSSNCGKTTVTMGLLRALSRKGLKVQPYKCGPDYIDPMFHRLACGTESVNLDTVMASHQHVKDIFQHYSEDMDICVVEGVMGLYDGRDRWQGSSAEIAMLLDLPVILIVNAKSTAYSVAPLLYGFKNFTPNAIHDTFTPDGKRNHTISTTDVEREVLPSLNIAGVIFNMVGSERHYNLLRQACEDAGIECLGYLGRNDKLKIPSRHLGLSISQMEEMEELINAAADEISQHVNIDHLCTLRNM